MGTLRIVGAVEQAAGSSDEPGGFGTVKRRIEFANDGEAGTIEIHLEHRAGTLRASADEGAVEDTVDLDYP